MNRPLQEQTIKALREEIDGFRENAEAIAVLLDVNCDEMDDAAMWHASVQCIKTLRERNAELEASYKDREPCGHPKNFLIGDEWGYFTCTVCERDRALSELAEARKALGDCREIITQSEMQCHHPADDGGPDCGNVDDCVYHALIEAIDAARAAIPENGATEAK